MLETLIYLFFLVFLFTVLFVYGQKPVSNLGNDELKTATKEVLVPVINNLDEQTDGYLCTFLQTNDKVLYRMEKTYGQENREYSLHNRWLFRTAWLVCLSLFLVIILLYIRVGLEQSIFTLVFNFMLVLVLTCITIVLLFMDELSNYKPVEPNYITNRIKRDMLDELNK